MFSENENKFIFIGEETWKNKQLQFMMLLEANVSMATVSRVVNGNPNVKPATRKSLRSD